MNGQAQPALDILLGSHVFKHSRSHKWGSFCTASCMCGASSTKVFQDLVSAQLVSGS